MMHGVPFALNFLACLAASATFLFIWMQHRELLVKPSIQVLFYVHLFVQWPLVFRQDRVLDLLPFPADAFLLVHGFTLIGLAVSLTSWHAPADEIFRRVTNTGRNYVEHAMPYVLMLLGLSALAAAIHIREVPLSELGLFVAIADPELAEAAREASFKMLDNPLVRYGFSLQTGIFAPLCAVFIYGMLERAIRNRRIVSTVACVAILMAILLTVSLTGARVFAALILFSLVAAAVIRRGFAVNPLSVLAGAVIVILPAVVLTLLRQGLLADLALIPEYFWYVIGDRVFGRPLEIGLWYMQHEQVFGSIGIRGLPRIADLLGVPIVSLPNKIGLMYTTTSIMSVSANAGYLFTFYAYFGNIALPVALLALWALDLLLLVLVRLDSQLLLPSLAAMAAAGLSFLGSDFMVTLVSHGYALIPVFAVTLALIRRIIVDDFGWHR